MNGGQWLVITLFGFAAIIVLGVHLLHWRDKRKYRRYILRYIEAMRAELFKEMKGVKIVVSVKDSYRDTRSGFENELSQAFIEIGAIVVKRPIIKRSNLGLSADFFLEGRVWSSYADTLAIFFTNIEFQVCDTRGVIVVAEKFCSPVPKNLAYMVVGSLSQVIERTKKCVEIST